MSKKNWLKSCAQLKFQILVEILINFGQRLRFFYIALKSYLVSHGPNWLKFGPDHLWIILKTIKEAFHKILIFCDFALFLARKIANFSLFWSKISIKLAKIKIFKKASLIVFKIIQRWSGPNFSQFGPKLWD